MPHVEVSRVVPATQAEVYAQLERMEEFPRFMESVKRIEVLERSPGSTRTHWVVNLQGSTFQWTEEDTFFPAEGRIAYRQIEGDLRLFEGEWRLEPVPEGTRVTLTTDFEFGMPMLASLLNPIAKLMLRKNVEAMLEGIYRSLS